LTTGNIALKKELSHLETSIKRHKTGCTNKSRFNPIFMKLPNSKKKQETKATLYTIKIMSLSTQDA
jgi:hypothetical protein